MLDILSSEGPIELLTRIREAENADPVGRAVAARQEA
jgi:hypothetical protein